MTRCIRTVAAIVVILAGAASVSAAEVNVSITAQIVDVADRFGVLSDELQPGLTITGLYTYETTDAVIEYDVPTAVRYLISTAPSRFIVWAGPYVFQTDPQNVDFKVEILNDHHPSVELPNGTDTLSVSSFNSLPLDEFLLPGLINWQLEDYSATAIDSTALPLDAPRISDWLTTNSLKIWGHHADYVEPGDDDPYSFDYYIHATVTQAQLVPEPATMTLLGAGLAFLLLRPRRP